MNQEDYDRRNGFNRAKRPKWIVRKTRAIRGACTDGNVMRNVWELIKLRIPIFGWLSMYSSNDLFSDVMSGSAVGVYVVPQAMSYALLAGVPPVNGLYSSFFPVIIYAILGTSPQSSIGVFSITCMMTGSCIRDFMTNHGADFPDVTPQDVAASLSCLTGMIQFGMARIRADVIMRFLPEPAIRAVTCSASLVGLVTQIPKVLGFSVPTRSVVFFGLFYSIYDICINIHNLNLATCVVSAVTLSIMIASHFFDKYIWQKYKTRRFPFPRDLIVLILGVASNYFLGLNLHFHIKTITNIPQGFPKPAVPRFDIMPFIYQPAFALAVVSYAVSMSMGQSMAQKHNYIMDPNQELYAIALTNIGSSFFGCFPTSCSLSRTLVNEKAGARTQLSSIIAATFIALVITLFGWLIEGLPICILSVIVCFVVFPLIINYTSVLDLWVYSKHCFFIANFTLIVSLCTDIPLGVLAGIVTAIGTIAYQSQEPSIKFLGRVGENDFRPLSHYSAALDTGFRIIRFDAALIFANVKKFTDSVTSTAEDIKKRRGSGNSQEGQDWTAIIFDCHYWNYTDSMGLTAVKNINEELQEMRILPLFASMKSSIRCQYKKAGVLEETHVTEKDIIEIKEKIAETERRIQEKRGKLGRGVVYYASNGTNHIDLEDGTMNEGEVRIEVENEDDNLELERDEELLKWDMKILAKREQKLARRAKETEKNRDKETKGKKISQNQIYPSIEDALNSAHDLVAKQQDFFEHAHRE